MILLNPGPVTLSDRVRGALGGEDLCHREPEFAALTQEVLQRIEAVYAPGPAYCAVLLSGSGTCAVEAMLSTFADRRRPTLVACNGVYGERMLEMLRRQGKPAVEVRSAWTDPVDLAGIRLALDAHPEAARLAVVHHETTTGRLNALDALAAICAERGIGLLLDAVSSFGGEDIPFARWQPLAVAGTANKCLHGVPGACFVVARKDALASGSSQSTSLYLDLAAYRCEQLQGWSPFTQAVQVVAALREALAEHADGGGWTARQRLYLQRSARVRAALARHGVSPLIPLDACASMLTAFRLPEADRYERVHEALKRRGFVIYAGQGDFRGRVFRIATMGSIAPADLDRLESALQEAFAGRC